MNYYHWLNYPSDYKKLLRPLLHQQMWLFGQDIMCPYGNLLYRHRFTHQRAETRGGSMYTRQDGNRQITLWGWGIWFGQEEVGAIYVNRYKARPHFTTKPSLTRSIHRPEDLPPLAHRLGSEAEVEAMRGLWCRLLLWLARYEAWVLTEWGPGWRRTALKPFPHAHTKPDEIDQLPDRWRALAEKSLDLPIKTYKG
ncbi:MAG: hypothetical protein R3C44_02615 [Chloroflexota bacterium]